MSTPPLVLVVDDRGLTAPGHPDAGYPDGVEFVEHLDLDAVEEDAPAFRDRYAAVLIHGNQNPPDELAFVAAEFSASVDGERKPHVRFVGEGDVAEELEQGYVEISRRRYADHVVPFLEHLRVTGTADIRIFAGHAPADTDARPPEVENPLPFTGSVTFSADGGEDASGVFAVPLVEVGRARGHVDWVQTLLPLANSDPSGPILLPQTIPGRPLHSGIQLLAHLRLSAFFLGPASRRPVLLALDDDAATLLRADPLHAVAFSAGTTVYPAGDALPDLPPPLSTDEQRSLAERLGTPPPAIGGPHDVANVWGPVSLQLNTHAVRTGTLPDLTEALSGSADRLFLDPFFWRLLTLTALRRSTDRAELDPEALRKRWSTWVAFLDGVVQLPRPDGSATPARPLRVAYVDDEAHRWTSALQDAFATGEAQVELLPFPPDETPVTLDAAAEFVRSAKPDLLLCDLRLQPAEEQAFSSPSPDYLRTLSGVQLLQRVKVERPTLPVVLFTASSKVWTLRHVLPLGADGYWVKEHPADAATPEDSVAHTVDLFDQVEAAITKRHQIDFLWRLHLRLASAAADTDFVDKSLAWPPKADWEAESPTAVQERLRAVADRVAQAYGDVERDPGPSRAASFALNQPYDIAFLSLFSATSEALRLFVRRANGCMYLLGPGRQALKYWSHGKAHMTKGLDPLLYAQARVNEENVRLTSEPHLEVLKLVLLNVNLPDERRVQLTTAFDAARKLRNKLRYVHGTEGRRGNQRSASLADVKQLAEVVFYLFRLDQHSPDSP